MKFSELIQNSGTFLFHSLLFTHQLAQRGSPLPALLVAKRQTCSLSSMDVLVVENKSEAKDSTPD